jgi:dsDNA-specific endonuclease/ATPase MutS2
MEEDRIIRIKKELDISKKDFESRNFQYNKDTNLINQLRLELEEQTDFLTKKENELTKKEKTIENINEENMDKENQIKEIESIMKDKQNK